MRQLFSSPSRKKSVKNNVIWVNLTSQDVILTALKVDFYKKKVGDLFMKAVSKCQASVEKFRTNMKIFRTSAGK